MVNDELKISRAAWFFVALGELILGSLLPCAFSQDVIISKDRFYVGEGTDQSLESARSAALQSLLLQIQAFISTSFVHTTKESGGLVDASAVASVVVRGAVTLKDVGERIVRLEDDNYLVQEFVSKETVIEMFRLRKARALELLKEASADIQNGSLPNVSSSLKRYFWAFLLAGIHPDTIGVPLEYVGWGTGFAKNATILSAVPPIMERILREISFRPHRRFVDGETTVWRCSVEYAGKPVGHLDYEYFDGVGSMCGEVRDGETSLNLYLRGDTLRPRDVLLRVDYRYEEEMDDLLRTADSLSSARTLLQQVVVSLPGVSLSSTETKEPQRLGKDAESRGMPRAIQVILNARGGFDGIMQTFQSLERQQKIVTGSATRFESLDGLYGVIVSAEGLVAIVHQRNGKLTDARSGAEANMKNYKGMRITWIQILEKEAP